MPMSSELVSACARMHIRTHREGSYPTASEGRESWEMAAVLLLSFPPPFPGLSTSRRQMIVEMWELVHVWLDRRTITLGAAQVSQSCV
jgi:hypothetical protein